MLEASACNSMSAFMLLLRQSIVAGEGHKAAKLRVKQQKVAGVAKVIGVSKLKGKYEPFEAKRQLCNSYDLFIADDRVVPSLPKLIGTHHALASAFLSHHSLCGNCKGLSPYLESACFCACSVLITPLHSHPKMHCVHV